MPFFAQVLARVLDLEYDLPHYCELFQKYAEADILLDAAPSALGGGVGNGGGGGNSRMFPGLRMTEDGWLRFQSVEQHERNNAVEQIKLFRAAANRRQRTSTSATGTGLPPPYATRLLPRAGPQRRPRNEANPETYLYQAKPDDVKGSSGSVVVAGRTGAGPLSCEASQRRPRDEAKPDAVGDGSFSDRTRVRQNTGSFSSVDLAVGGGGSLTFVEFVKLLLSPSNRALDPAALVPEESHANAPLTHFWIATSHNSYAVGHQLTGYADEAMYRRLLLQGCRSLEIDCWNGARGEPIVTHGNTLVTKISFASVAKAVSETAFVTSQAPVLLSLEMHCGKKQQARIAELLKKELGALLLTCAELECLFEAQSPPARKLERHESARKVARHFGEDPSESKLPFQALRGRVLIKSKLLTPDNDEDDESSEPVMTSSKSPNAKRGGGRKGVIEPNLRALITMPSVPAARIMTGDLPPSGQRLPVSSLSEPLLESIFAAAGEDLRAEAASRVQRITRGWQACGCTAPPLSARHALACFSLAAFLFPTPAHLHAARTLCPAGSRLSARHAHQVRQRRPALPVGHGRAAGGAQPADERHADAAAPRALRAGRRLWLRAQAARDACRATRGVAARARHAAPRDHHAALAAPAARARRGASGPRARPPPSVPHVHARVEWRVHGPERQLGLLALSEHRAASDRRLLLRGDSAAAAAWRAA